MQAFYVLASKLGVGRRNVNRCHSRLELHWARLNSPDKKQYLRMTTISCIETLWFFVALEAFCTLCFFFLHRTSSFWSSHSGTRWSGIRHHPKLFANVVTWLHSIALVTRAFREAAGFISTASKDGGETWWCCWQSRKYRWFVKGESVELDSCLANRNVPNSENIGDFPLAFQYSVFEAWRSVRKSLRR